MDYLSASKFEIGFPSASSLWFPLPATAVPAAGASPGTGALPPAGAAAVPGAGASPGTGAWPPAGAAAVPAAGASPGTGAWPPAGAAAVPGAGASPGTGAWPPAGAAAVPGAGASPGTGRLGHLLVLRLCLLPAHHLELEPEPPAGAGPPAGASPGTGAWPPAGAASVPAAGASPGTGAWPPAGAAAVPAAGASPGTGAWPPAGAAAVPGAGASPGTGAWPPAGAAAVPGAGASPGTGAWPPAGAAAVPGAGASPGTGGLATCWCCSCACCRRITWNWRVILGHLLALRLCLRGITRNGAWPSAGAAAGRILPLGASPGTGAGHLPVRYPCQLGHHLERIRIHLRRMATWNWPSAITLRLLPCFLLDGAGASPGTGAWPIAGAAVPAAEED